MIAIVRRALGSVGQRLVPMFGQISRCVVLNYHGLVEKIESPKLERNLHPYALFEKQVRYLSRRYAIISLEELRAKLEGREDVARCAVLTFDDGYANNLAIPDILDRIAPRIPFAVFLTAGCIGNKRESIWMANLSLLLLKGDRKEVAFRGQTYSLADDRRREGAFDEIRAQLKRMATADKNRCFGEILEQFGEASVPELVDRYPQFKMMDWSECETLARRHGDLEAHGVAHELLHPMQSEEVVAREIGESRSIIAERTGRIPVCFAFPNGDNSAFAVAQLQRHGYAMAFTTKPGHVSHGDDLFRLNRVTPDKGMERFIYKLHVRLKHSASAR